MSLEIDTVKIIATSARDQWVKKMNLTLLPAVSSNVSPGYSGLQYEEGLQG